MRHSTYFYGTLEFTRRLSLTELEILDGVLSAGRISNDRDRPAIEARVFARQKERGHGPKFFDTPNDANMVADMKGFTVGEGLSPQYAGDMMVDGGGLVHHAEKTYDLVAGVNFIIVNARNLVPYFGLKGRLAADTDFAPYQWFLTIGSDGLAKQSPASVDDVIKYRREHRRSGYNDEEYGITEPQRSGPLWSRLIKMLGH